MSKLIVSSSVLFWPGAYIPSLEGKGPFAAIVTKVINERSVNVVFFGDEGGINFAPARTLWRGEIDGPRPGASESYCEAP